MDQFMETVLSEGPVSDEQALAVLEILGPVVTAAPGHEDAVGAASQVIARMSSESVIAAVLDWWLVVTAGVSPLGMAYHLPESLPVPTRASMEAVTALSHQGLTVPPAQWLHLRRSLASKLEELDWHLVLDNYGSSKLPGERPVWADLVDEMQPTVDALRHGRRAEAFDFDLAQYQKDMHREDIDEGSRRWKEMIRRATVCLGFVDELVELQHRVEPWVDRPIPEPIKGASGIDLGPLTELVLRSILDSDLDDQQVNASHVARVTERIESVAADLSDVDLAWLAGVVRGWMDATGAQVPTLQAMTERRHLAEQRIRRLQDAGLDTDEAELHLLDNDIGAAERALGQLEQQQKDERRTISLRAALERFKAIDEVAVPSEEWKTSLSELEVALVSGEIAPAERLAQTLDRGLRQSRRSEALSELRLLHAELERLDAPASVLTELADQLARLDGSPDQAVDPSFVERTVERLDAVRSQLRSEVTEHLRRIAELLGPGGDLLAADDRPNFELRLAEAEAELDTGELIVAKELSMDLLAEMESRRVHRWAASDGEAALVEHVVDYCTQQISFAPDDVRRLYVSAKTKPFVILAGLTGSGKSTIARLFAAALGAEPATGRFRRVAVRPDWIDQSEVLGTVHPLNNRFEPGWLAEVARDCERNQDQLHVVLLDEMNLAPVEQYLAEYLSALEEARSGAARTALPLYSSAATPDNARDWPSTLPFPRNLILIGTVNVDETTRVLSDRVLDRANVLQLSVTVSDDHHRLRDSTVRPWAVPYAEWESICVDQPDDGHHEFLIDIGETLQRVGVGVGQRAHIEVERFVANARDVLAPEASLDLAILQRIIPKVRGFKRVLAPSLTELAELFQSTGCDRSRAVIDRWLDDDVPDDEYLDGTETRIGLIG